MTPLSDLPPGARAVLIAALELLAVLREQAEELPEDVLVATEDFEAVVGEHVGLIDT